MGNLTESLDFKKLTHRTDYKALLVHSYSVMANTNDGC